MLLLSSAYISAARRLSPSVPRELEEYIATAYSCIRQEEARSNAPHSYTTVRTLLSILRISAVSLHLFPTKESSEIRHLGYIYFSFWVNDLCTYVTPHAVLKIKTDLGVG